MDSVLEEIDSQIEEPQPQERNLSKTQSMGTNWNKENRLSSSNSEKNWKLFSVLHHLKSGAMAAWEGRWPVQSHGDLVVRSDQTSVLPSQPRSSCWLSVLATSYSCKWKDLTYSSDFGRGANGRGPLWFTGRGFTLLFLTAHTWRLRSGLSGRKQTGPSQRCSCPPEVKVRGEHVHEHNVAVSISKP